MNDFLILYNIRSVHNVASIFRTADAAGVSKIYLCGYTPSPIDRFGRWRKDFAKVSLGAEGVVQWELREDILGVIRELRTLGITVIAVEQSPKAISYRYIPKGKYRAFIFGNETEGLPEEILREADLIAEIPMRGKMVRQDHHPRHGARGKESLNVAVAAGIVLFRL